jgi:hypothetical protein
MIGSICFTVIDDKEIAYEICRYKADTVLSVVQRTRGSLVPKREGKEIRVADVRFGWLPPAAITISDAVLRAAVVPVGRSHNLAGRGTNSIPFVHVIIPDR